MNMWKSFFNNILYKHRNAIPKSLETLIMRVKGNGVDEKALSYLTTNALSDLARAVIEIERQQIPGVIVEAGCALGGSSIILASAKSETRSLNCYDIFGLIPPPSSNDGEDVHQRYEKIVSGQSEGLNGEIYYGYQENLFEVVTSNFLRFGLPLTENNISLIRGLYKDTLLLNEPVALAHIDCDWYDSVMLCLNRIYPCLSTGAIIIIDDYEHYSGARRAVDEFLSAHKSDFIKRNRERLQLIKC